MTAVTWVTQSLIASAPSLQNPVALLTRHDLANHEAQFMLVTDSGLYAIVWSQLTLGPVVWGC